MSERAEIEQAIAALEAQRALFSDAVFATTLAPLREKLAALEPLPAPESQRKMATVLFADVQNYTPLSATLDAEELSETMNALWRRVDPIISRHGGTIVQHFGDSLMALFGAPTAREDDPERAIRTALAVHEELAAAPGKHRFRMRVGINTGPVLIGNAGTNHEYTAVGDAVNVASRLEKAAPVGGTLISHDTYRHVRGVFNTQALEPLAVKGKSEPVKVYVVLKLKEQITGPDRHDVEGIETRTIGREAELGRLQEAFFAVMRDHRTQVITVIGDAGVGKSRLLFDFTEWLELRPERIWHFQGRSRQELSKRPYALLRDVFSTRFQIQDSDSAEAARAKMEAGVSRFFDDAGSAVEVAHFLGQLIGLDFSASPHLQGIRGDAKQIHDRAFHHAAQLFSALARRLPTVIFLEDIHWADDGSLDLVEDLARSCAELPVLILCLARNTLFEWRPGWGANQTIYHRVDLNPLSKADSHLLVAEILRKIESLPQALAELIVGRTEGNPFFIEELIKMLIDDRVISKGEDRWKVEPAQLVSARVPPTLVGVLQARLDSLPPAERELLQRASVIGRVFWEDAVTHLCAQAPAECFDAVEPVGETNAENRAVKIHNLIASLRAKEMVFRRERSSFAGTREYFFKHALLHRTTYDSVLKRLRRVYHAHVAEWIASRSSSRAEEFSVPIAEHYELAEVKLPAAEWYGRAGKQAFIAYAPQQAIGYYRKALELLAGVEAEAGPLALTWRVNWREGLGDALATQAQFSEAQGEFSAMRAAAESAGDLVAQARAWNGLAFTHERKGEYQASLDRARQAQAIAESAGNSAAAQKAVARALYLQGWAFYRLADAPSVLALGEQILALCTKLNTRWEKANSLKLLGVAHLLLDRYADADRFFEEGRILAEELGDRYTVAAMWSNLGESARMRGDYPRAVSLYQNAVRIIREIGHSAGEMIYLNNLAGALLWLGAEECQTAEKHLRRVLSGAGSVVWFNLAETHRFLSEACLRQRKIAEAMDAAWHSLAAARENGTPYEVGHGWRAVAEVLCHPNYQGPPPASAGTNEADDVTANLGNPRACFETSLTAFTAAKAKVEQARTLRGWARYEQAQGHREQAAALCRQARALFAEVGAEAELERMEDRGSELN